jgi:hypothetical protein
MVPVVTNVVITVVTVPETILKAALAYTLAIPCDIDSIVIVFPCVTDVAHGVVIACASATCLTVVIVGV